MHINMMRLLPLAAVALIVVCSACRKERKVDVAASLNPKKMPTMTTTNVATFISDSGIVQYKVVAPVWYVYDNIDTPYWWFPKGLYLQKFDAKYKTIASVACDSARYFKSKKLWRLDGNVEMHRAPSDLFMTQQLFWDERKHIIYSDSFMHIETPTQILEGYGFEANEQITRYTVRRPSGVFPFDPNHSIESSPASPAGAPDQPVATEVRDSA